MNSTISGLGQHRQLFSVSCAPSGMEAVLKLHGLIDPDAFPYQNKFQNEPIGFEKIHLLLAYRIEGKDTWMPLEDAINKITSETKSGRFPLVSLLTGRDKDNTFWHIFAARQHGCELQLIDPGKLGGEIHATSTDEVRRVFEFTLAKVPNRQEINFLTYTFINCGDETQPKIAT